MSDPVKEVAEAVVRVETAPKELAQVRLEQAITSAMLAAKLRLDMRPCAFDGVSMHCWVIGVDEMQAVIDKYMVGKRVIGAPTIS